MLDMDPTPVTATSETPPPDGPRPRAGRAFVVFAVLAVFLSGAGIGWLVRPAPEAAETAAATVTTVATVASSTPVATQPPNTDGPALGASSEPVADVADAVLPAVVEIQLDQGGLGSGVIYDSEGLIMTAAHVVDGFDTVKILFSTGARVTGTVVGVDTTNDIAVVSVDQTNLPAAALALDTKPRAGQLAVALGSPWGLDSTVTAGIISSAAQVIGSPSDPRLMLQTDASINPGNSGGPLVDREGRVLGINVSIYSTSGANDGVGFAVPIDRAYRVASAIVEGRTFHQGLLGVTVGPTDSGQAGSTVTIVNPGSAAAAAGIQVGDTIIAVDGDPIPDSGMLGAVIRNHEAGDSVDIQIQRAGETIVLPVVLDSV